MSMNNPASQRKKIIALLIFVGILGLTSWYLFNLLVKPSPYYPKTEQTTDGGD